MDVTTMNTFLRPILTVTSIWNIEKLATYIKNLKKQKIDGMLKLYKSYFVNLKKQKNRWYFIGSEWKRYTCLKRLLSTVQYNFLGKECQNEEKEVLANEKLK